MATWSGTVRFETRAPTPTGASQARGTRVARRVQLRAVTFGGQPLGEATTDAEGRFSIEAPEDAHRLEVLSRIDHEGHDLAVSRDNAGEELHVYEHELAPPTGDSIEITIGDVHASAGALHILDMLYEGSLAVRRWLDRRLPPFFAYWSRGVTTEWSFYTGENVVNQRYAIELLGGDPGQQFTTDTDEHDEAIVLHEFGHFVMDVLSSDSSHGGSHPRGALINPGLAWEEGRATWFATAVLASPLYQDTIGVQPTGTLRVNHDLERALPPDLGGMGSEATVAEVLWDLSDGEVLEDIDDDGADLGPAGVLRAMIELGQEPGAHPALPTFLRLLVRTGRVSEEAMAELLAHNGEAPEMLPRDDESVWPIDLGLPGHHADKIDGLTNPAPSGGPNRASNGFDATRTYRVHLERDGRLQIELRIFGSGRATDHEDLDLELRDIRSGLIDAARGETQRERISRSLEAGWYVIYVRDGGGANRAGYELDVRLL